MGKNDTMNGGVVQLKSEVEPWGMALGCQPCTFPKFHKVHLVVVIGLCAVCPCTIYINKIR